VLEGQAEFHFEHGFGSDKSITPTAIIAITANAKNLFIFMFTPFPFVLTDYGLDWFCIRR
jgi:hypothetical protein